jgi:hypothetical protein
MPSNYQTTIKASQERISFLIHDVNRQLIDINKKIATLERDKQTLLEMKAIAGDYGRLVALEVAKG